MANPRMSAAQRRASQVGKAKHSTRFNTLLKQVDQDEALPIEAALARVKELATAKFDETVDVAIALGVDPRHGDQVVRGTVNLPHGTGRSRRVAVFARGDKADEARAAGADEVGAEDLVERIQKGWTGWTQFDLFVASPDMMPLVGRVGSVLKQKMPNPKAGTVTPNVASVVRDIKGASRAEYRVERAGIIHCPIGKASFTADQLAENLLILIAALIKAKPSAAKGRYLKGITVSPSMGPGVKIDTTLAQKAAERI